MFSENNYDDQLFPILYSEDTIFGFFDRIFDFLYRKTDFFKLKGIDSDEFGLMNGEAEKIVRSVFCKYMEEAANERKHNEEPVPLDCVAKEVIVNTTELDNEKTSLSTPGENTLKEKETSTPDEQTVVPVMDSDSYNGASYEGYSWSQSIKDIDIRLKVPHDVCSGKQVRVELCQSNIKVELCGAEDNSWSTLKEGDFSWPINVEGSTWTLVPNEHIHVYVHKLQDGWWSSLLKGEPAIDLRAIDNCIAYEELDPDSRDKIRELMQKEHLKRMGEAQDAKIENILKEAWDKEGSPFKGQPYDPSILHLQNS